jgi:hypothetical protein
LGHPPDRVFQLHPVVGPRHGRHALDETGRQKHDPLRIDGLPVGRPDEIEVNQLVRQHIAKKQVIAGDERSDQTQRQNETQGQSPMRIKAHG